ncbi:MAG: hypothetical protein WCW16_00070 [Candidatus Magasanikbacteria bacterium]
MKKMKIILLVVLFIFFLSILTWGGRQAWNHTVIFPILSYFSSPSGYDGTSEWKVDCPCEGFMIKDIGVGATEYRCIGTPGPCTCFKRDLNQNGLLTQLECSNKELEDLHWAFQIK